jgi:hypothetical protein
MQGTALRSQLRTNVPGFTSTVGTLTVDGSGVPAVGAGKNFTVGRGVLSLTVAGSPTIVGAPNGTYTNVPITTAFGTTGVCSLTVAGGAGVISTATVTAPGYDYTAATTMNVAVGSLFWTGAVLSAGSGLTNGTYYVPILNTSGSGMIARVVVAGNVISTVTVNPATTAGTAVGSNYGTGVITYDLPANALYSGSPAITGSFSLTPNPVITVGTITSVVTGNFSVIYAGRVFSTVAGLATPMVKPGNTFFTVGYRYGGQTYANFTTLKNVTSGTPNVADLTGSSATPSSGDGFAFQIISTDTEVTV